MYRDSKSRSRNAKVDRYRTEECQEFWGDRLFDIIPASSQFLSNDRDSFMVVVTDHQRVTLILTVVAVPSRRLSVFRFVARILPGFGNQRVLSRDTSLSPRCRYEDAYAHRGFYYGIPLEFYQVIRVFLAPCQDVHFQGTTKDIQLHRRSYRATRDHGDCLLRSSFESATESLLRSSFESTLPLM